VRSVVDRAALGKAFSEYFVYPCHSFILLTALQSSPSIIQDQYSRPINGVSDSGLADKQIKQIMEKSFIGHNTYLSFPPEYFR
jgi:hypothetical protein